MTVKQFNHTVKSPTVSVIMNCLNGEKYLQEAIDSIYSQTYEDWEIIFWNDKDTTDKSAKIAQSYNNKLKYFKADINLPLYAARNLALKQAKGKLIAFLDCDDIWLPSKLELQVQAFEKNKKLGLIYTNVKIIEPNGTKRSKYNKLQPSGRIFQQLLMRYSINLQTVIISKAALDDQDYWFDNSLLFSGDADLFLRIVHDWEVQYVPEVTALYREHETSLSATRIEVLPIENEKILLNLSERYEGFMETYKAEIEKFRAHAQLSVILAKWKHGNKSEARQIITKNLSLSWLFILLYFLSFLPFKIVNSIRNLAFI